MSFLYWDPAKNWRYEHRFQRLLHAPDGLLADADRALDTLTPGGSLRATGLTEEGLSMLKALYWLRNRGIDENLVLSFRGTVFTGADLLVLFAAGLTDTEIAARRDAGARPDNRLRTLAALRPPLAPWIGNPTYTHPAP